MQANVIRTALVQNVGDAELQFFAVFRTSQYEEMSLSDWLRHSPPEMVAQPLECGRSDNLEVAEQSAAHYARVTEPGALYAACRDHRAEPAAFGRAPAAYGFARRPPGSRPAAHTRGDGDRTPTEIPHLISLGMTRKPGFWLQRPRPPKKD
jgi:hypothetical protein